MVHNAIEGQNLSGNRVVGNRIGTNNRAGDPDFAPCLDQATTAIFVGAIGPLRITICGHVIRNNRYGIWMMPR